jgi:hypothetical protein
VNTRDAPRRRSKTPFDQPFEVIQQWQYTGPANRDLLTDAAFENCKSIGITSLQSYVPWSEVESVEGSRDFSAYDPLVEALRRHGLKWVPFLILGPYYATPKWFLNSGQSLFAKCLEHGRESKVQSIWNPHLPRFVERFIEVFAERYGSSGLIESICLGISGNWGEAIYPATGCFLGGFHVHPGWWCGDEYAKRDFRARMLERYGVIEGLNSRWGTRFRDQSAIAFPDVSRPTLEFLFSEFKRRVPTSCKPLLKSIKGALTVRVIRTLPRRFRSRICAIEDHPNPTLRRCLDFVQWYQDSMTRWAKHWIKSASSHFAGPSIYLVTGGDGEPWLGADFSAQVAVAAKFGAGVRITNHSDHYADSFARSRLVTSASKYYRAFFTTEEAGVNSAAGVTMRVFDALSSGAAGLYCKGLMGIGHDPCSGRSSPYGGITEGGRNLQRFRTYLRVSAPLTNVAVLYPNTSIAVRPAILPTLHFQCARLRALLDFDLADENMIRDGCLDNYRFLVLLAGDLLRRGTIEKVEDWIRSGGILISTIGTPFEAGEQTGNFEMGLGHLMVMRDSKDHIRFISDAVIGSLNSHFRKAFPEYKHGCGRSYATLFEDRIMRFDPATSRIEVERLDASAPQGIDHPPNLL